jgi:hypothetical protein
MLESLDLVLSKKNKNEGSIDLRKFRFLVEEINFLGHRIRRNCIQPMKKDIKAIKNYIKPQMAKEMKSFLGLGSYERKYIPRFAQYEKTPGGCITNEKMVMWTKEGEGALEHIKKAIANSNRSAMFKEEADTFILCDASGKSLGARLMQIHGK